LWLNVGPMQASTQHIEHLIESLEHVQARAVQTAAENPWPEQERFHDGYIMAMEHALDFARLELRLQQISLGIYETEAK